MLQSPAFMSFAQNREDVVLWRALKAVTDGRYVDVGANQPAVDSVTRAFYDHGWRGIAVEPVPSLAAAFAAERPNDIVVQAAATDSADEQVTLHSIADTGLSTTVDEIANRHHGYGLAFDDIAVPARRLDDILEEAGWGGAEIHFVVVDVEGGEAAALRSFDLERWRPWVLVIEATSPRESRQTYREWEKQVTDAGYQFCLFDGLSRYYVSPDHPDLMANLSYPACSLDVYDTLEQAQHREQLQEREAHIRRLDEHVEDLRSQIVRWRTAALNRWADSTLGGAPHFDAIRVSALENELTAIRQTVSWRVTAPLRTVRRMARP